MAWAANKKTINGGVWALYGIGAVSMLAFHVWEVVDIWTRPVVKKGRRASLDGFDDEPASPRFALLPAVIPDGGGLALGLRY